MSSLIGILLIATTPQKSVSVEVPKVDWASQSVAETKDRSPDSEGRISQIAVRAARWSPTGLSLRSRMPQVSEFQSTLLPRVDVAYHYSLKHWSGIGTVNAIGGAGISQLMRSGQVTAGGSLRSGSQSLFLFPAFVGAEIKPSLLTFRRVYASFSAAALPVLGMSAPSSIADGQNVLGIGGEAGASLTVTMSSDWPELMVTGYYDWALVQSSAVQGFGIGAGVKAGI